MKRVLSFVLSLVITLGVITRMDVSVFASASTTQISISDTKKAIVVGSSLAVSANYSSDTYSHNSDTISIDISGKADGLTVDGGGSCLGTKEDGIISYSLVANQVGKYTVTISGPDGSCDSLDVYVTETNGYFTVAGKLEQYVTSVVLDESGENWVSEIIVDGITYPIQKHLIDSDRAENAKGKDVVFTVYDSEVDSFYIIDDLSTTATVEFSPLNLIYENGRFPDKKIDLSGYINVSSTINSQINQEILSSYNNLTLSDINITLTSGNTDIIYFKTGTFSGKDSSVTFSLDGNLTIGESKLFSQEARVNTGYSFPENLEEDIVKITCSLNATCGDVPVSDTTELIVKLTNNDYNHKSTWRKQSLISLMEQMQSSVSSCSVLTSIERAEVSNTISAIIINEQMSKLSDDLDAFESIYDLSCYFYGLNTATMATAGEYFLDAIISECNTASDDLKRELNNLLESLTESDAFNKFIYWYYNNQQLQLGNKKQVNAHCPIDVSVTDEDGQEVLSIVNDEVVTSLEGATGFVCDSQKTLYLPTDIDHKIKITATADGTMDYSVVEYSSAGTDRVVSYSDIALTNGEIYTGSIIRTELPSEDSYKLTTSSDLTFTLSDDGTYYSVTDCNSYASGWIVIPSTYKGLPVTRIGTDAFYNCTNLTQIEIPDTVTNIGYSAFNCCRNLVSIIIPDSVTSIEHNTFYICESLISITIGNSVTSIGADAFYCCTSLTTINIPSSVTRIDNRAFQYCKNLTSIIIGDGVASIGADAFEDCTSLISINVDVNNSKYSSVDGVLFNKDKTTLIKYPASKLNILYTVPNTTNIIYDDAFYKCTNLASITIGDNVINIGNNAFESCSNLISMVIPNSVTSIGNSVFSGCTNLISINISDNIKSIGNETFRDCKKLESITIPDDVTSIGTYAFRDCDSLTSVTIPDSVTSIGGYVFDGCDNLMSVIISNGVTSIGKGAFYFCTKLTSIAIPDSVTTIGDDAFYACKNLTSIIIPNTLTSIGNGVFTDCDSLTSITIPDSVTSIGKKAFSSCSNLTSITIPDNVTNIGGLAFGYCTNLNTVTIGDGVISIGTEAFYNCNNLSSVVIGDSVTSIGDYAFAYCDNLFSIDIPQSVTSIGNNAFMGCKSVESIKVDENNLNYSSVDDVLFNKDKTILIMCNKGKTEYTIPDTVTSIGDNAFTSCTKLKSITIPNSVTSIGKYAFQGCDKLIDVVIPSNVTNIDTYSFAYCDNLFSITIGGGVTSIGSWAFGYCENLTLVTIGDSVTNIGDSAFYLCNKLAYVFYPGSESAWENIVINSYNTRLINAIIHYNSTDHSYGDLLIKEPKCAESGLKYYECSICGYVDEIELLPNLGGHTCSNWIVETEATCTEDGLRYKECTVCNEVVETETTPALGHTSSNWIDDIEATCTEDGLRHKECIVCGLVIETESIRASSHNYSTEWTIDAIATCTEEGSKSHHCLDCDSITDITVIAAIGHIASDWIIDEYATCIATGLKHKECTVCSEELEAEQIISQGHNWDNNICTVCGLSKLDLIESEHPYGSNIDESWTIYREGAGSISVTFSEDTKTESGYDFIYIYDGDNNQVGKYSGTQLAGQTITVNDDTVIIRLTSDSGFNYYGFEVTKVQYESSCTHNWEKDSTNSVPATCTESGVKAETCSMCGKIRKTEIPATGHKSSSWITDKKATVYSAGKKHKECTECGKVLETAKIAQLKCSKPKLKEIENTTSGVKITWGKVSGVDKYYVYRKTSGSYKKIGTTTKTYYTDKKASSGKKYYYVVKAVNEAGSSDSSKSLSKLYLADPTLKTPKSTKKGINLNWSKVTGAQGYVIYYKTGSGSYKKLTTVKGNSKVKYTHTKAKKGKTYTYKVKAYKSKTYSAYSNAKKIKDKY